MGWGEGKTRTVPTGARRNEASASALQRPAGEVRGTYSSPGDVSI